MMLPHCRYVAKSRVKRVDFATYRQCFFVYLQSKHLYAMLIGREQEQAKLKAAYESEYSEFVAIYGRRRVGKTFLVREYFNYKFTFSHTGVSKKTHVGSCRSFICR